MKMPYEIVCDLKSLDTFASKVLHTINGNLIPALTKEARSCVPHDGLTR